MKQFHQVIASRKVQHQTKSKSSEPYELTSSQLEYENLIEKTCVEFSDKNSVQRLEGKGRMFFSDDKR